MNELRIRRLTADERPTIGLVFFAGEFLCFSLEDRMRTGPKVPGDTRIPAGTYPLRWRRLGRWAKRFAANYGVPGSLELGNVPGFTDILLHVGNRAGESEGCVLLGMGADFENRTITKSVKACRKIYKLIHRTGGDWQILIEG